MKKKIGMVLFAVVVVATLVAFVLPTDAQAATQPAVATDEVAAYLATPVTPDGTVATAIAAAQPGQSNHGAVFTDLTALSLPSDVPVVPAAAVLICLIAVAAVTFRYYTRIMAFTTIRQPGVARDQASTDRVALWQAICSAGMTFAYRLMGLPLSEDAAKLFVDGAGTTKRTRSVGTRSNAPIHAVLGPSG